MRIQVRSCTWFRKPQLSKPKIRKGRAWELQRSSVRDSLVQQAEWRAPIPTPWPLEKGRSFWWGSPGSLHPPLLSSGIQHLLEYLRVGPHILLPQSPCPGAYYLVHGQKAHEPLLAPLSPSVCTFLTMTVPLMTTVPVWQSLEAGPGTYAYNLAYSRGWGRRIKNSRPEFLK